MTIFASEIVPNNLKRYRIMKKENVVPVFPSQKFIWDLKSYLIDSIGNLASSDDFKSSSYDFSQGLVFGECNAFSKILKMIIEYETND